MESEEKVESITDKKLKIMIIDDNPDDRTLTIRELKKQFNNLSVEEIINRSEFEEALEKGNFDLVITDYRLRWTTGLDILREVKSQWPKKPVIMFTGTGTEEIAVEAMKKGLNDYIVKSPKHFIRLPASVKSIMERIEERRMAKKAIKESELKYKAIFENTGTGSFIFNKKGMIEIINNEFEKLSGYDRKEISGKKTWKDFVVKEDHEKFDNHLETTKTYPELSPETFRINFVNRYGDIREVLTSLNNIPETDKIIGSLLDITRYKQTMDALQASEEMFRVAFENAPNGMALASLEGKLLEVNDSLCDILGYSEAEILSINYEDLVHPEDLETLKGEFNKLASGQRDVYEEKVKFIKKDKKIKEFNVIISLVKNQKNEPLYHIIQIT